MTAFGDLPPELTQWDTAAVAVVPVPYDGTSTYRKGADKGPAALLDASAYLELYDIETGSEVYRRGIHTAEPPGRSLNQQARPEDVTQDVRSCVDDVLSSGMLPVVIGGEHSVSLGAIMAVRDRFPNLGVLQIDAHSDLRDEYEGSRYNHACVMARVRELCPIVQVGIRSMDRSELGSMDATRVFFGYRLAEGDDWMAEAVSLLPDEVYLTFDLDGLDPSIMPSTGTPEPGGLSWYQALRFLRLVAQSRKIVAFDIVELCPTDTHAPDFLAAKLLYKILSYIGESGGL